MTDYQQINTLPKEQYQRLLLLERPEEDELSLESTTVLHKLMSLDARASVKSICDSRSGLSYRLGRRRNSGGVVHGELNHNNE